MLYLVSTARPIEHAMMQILKNDGDQMNVVITKMSEDDVRQLIEDHKSFSTMYFPRLKSADGYNFEVYTFDRIIKDMRDKFGLELDNIDPSTPIRDVVDYQYNMFVRLLKFPTTFEYKAGDIVVYVEFHIDRLDPRCRWEITYDYYKMELLA